jgi:hypothetical protein
MVQKTVTERTPGMSHKSIMHGVDFFIGFSIQMLFMGNPVMDLLFAGVMFLDILDPHNYNHTFTRKALDDSSKKGYDGIEKILHDVDLRAKITRLIRKAGPSLSDAQVLAVLNSKLSHYKIHTTQPADFNTCFSDMMKYDPANGGDVSMSGKPTSKCDPTYAAAYNVFYAANKEKYIQKKIASSDNILALAEKFTKVMIEKNVEQNHQGYISQLIVLGGLVGVSLAAVLVWFAVLKVKEKARSGGASVE